MRARHRHFTHRSAGIAAAYDARKLSQSNGTEITSWPSAGSTALTLNAKTSNFPTFSAADANFGGCPTSNHAAGQGIKTNATSISANISFGWTFAAIRFTGSTDSYRLAVGVLTPSLYARASLYGRNNSASEAGGRRLDADSYQYSGSALSDNVPAIIDGEFNYGAATLRFSVNGTGTDRSGGFQSAGNTSNTNGEFWIGTDSASSRFTGQVAQVLFANQSVSRALQRRIRHAAAYSFKIACN